MFTNVGLSIENEKWARIAVKRLAKRRGKEGFANARDVRNLYERIVTRHAQIQTTSTIVCQTIYYKKSHFIFYFFVIYWI